MASVITVRTNITQVFSKLQADLNKLKDREYLLRPVATEIIPMMTERIHQKGLASDNTAIGTYSNNYMKVRTGNFKNSKKFVRGKNAGKNKNAGVKTKQRIATPFGKSRYAYQNIEADGVAREQYNRSSDTKVIVSLTRQLENDWSVVATERGYGIGFLNSFNAKKLRWVEAMKKKVIGRLSKEETDYAIDRINELVNAAINN